MRVFFDSSAFAKRYINETGSEQVAEICAGTKEIAISALAIPEILSAFNRLKRAGKLSLKDYKKLKSVLFKDISEILVVHIDNTVLIKAISCLEKQPLRTLDAIQVATAKGIFCDLFVSADRKQSSSAKELGLKTKLIE